MAKSKYEYVKSYEKPDTLLPSTYIVVRVDGRAFHKLASKYQFEKPNDRRALNLMNAAAKGAMGELPDICIAYGLSDEFSFVFDKTCDLFERRESKIVTTVVSTFTSYYVYLWPTYFPSNLLSPPLPSFDARAVLYPNEWLLRDYVSWRQVDCHINNLYNTTFWALVDRSGMSPTQAEEDLKGTVAADKNEILFSRFDINYNNEPELFRKGSVVYRNYDVPDGVTSKSNADKRGQSDEIAMSKTRQEKERKRRAKASIEVEHTDIIKDDFWQRRPWLLSGRARGGESTSMT